MWLICAASFAPASLPAQRYSCCALGSMDTVASFRARDPRGLYEWLRSNSVDEADARFLRDNKFTGETLYSGFLLGALESTLKREGIASGICALIQFKIQALQADPPAAASPSAASPSLKASKKREYGNRTEKKRISNDLLAEVPTRAARTKVTSVPTPSALARLQRTPSR